MNNLKLIAVSLLGACSIASAQDVLLTGHVQRIVLQPYGTENCPPPCAATRKAGPDGTQSICISNGGGCQTMEMKVDHVYRGAAVGETRQFKSGIGEWGPSFPNTDRQIVVSAEAGDVRWSFATERNGKIFIDPKRLPKIGGIPTSAKGDEELVELDEVLARGKADH